MVQFAISRTMRRFFLVLLFLCSLAGCHNAGSRIKNKQRAGQVTDPERVESIETMSAAETEARRQMNNW